MKHLRKRSGFMNKTKKKITAIAVFVLAVVLIPIAVFAVKNAVSPISSGGGFVQKTIDRINISVDKTDFVFNKDGNGAYRIAFTLTAEKTEADFFAKLDSFEVDGQSFGAAIVSPVGNSSEFIIDGAVLPASNGKAEQLSWKIEVPFTADSAGTYTGEIKLSFTSGITEDTADSHLLTIPLTVEIK